MTVLKTKYTDLNILCISDMHIPYDHPDALDFLEAIKEAYQPDLVVSLGDLADFHGISFHSSDPDLLSAGDEIIALRERSAELESLFPEMIIIGSNHGDLPIRKFLHHGLPRALLKEYRDIYQVGEGWQFVDDLTISEKGQPDIYMAHGIRKNALQIAQQRGQRFICGHFHENFEIRYCGTPEHLLWSVMSGCLIDKSSLAFAYNKLNMNRPIIGTAVIEKGFPLLLPMVLDSKGRWIKEIV